MPLTEEKENALRTEWIGVDAILGRRKPEEHIHAADRLYFYLQVGVQIGTLTKEEAKKYAERWGLDTRLI
ncbi:MAG: hypothetical protein FJ044_00590 [Candidatus Cloacimonetes bacterium]|nr:hypothetical protein [Candidatus Cloacimonadota bacterium]